LGAPPSGRKGRDGKGGRPRNRKPPKRGSVRLGSPSERGKRKPLRKSIRKFWWKENFRKKSETAALRDPKFKKIKNGRESRGMERNLKKRVLTEPKRGVADLGS